MVWRVRVEQNQSYKFRNTPHSVSTNLERVKICGFQSVAMATILEGLPLHLKPMQTAEFHRNPVRFVGAINGNNVQTSAPYEKFSEVGNPAKIALDVLEEKNGTYLVHTCQHNRLPKFYFSIPKGGCRNASYTLDSQGSEIKKVRFSRLATTFLWIGQSFLKMKCSPWSDVYTCQIWNLYRKTSRYTGIRNLDGL